MRPEEPVEAVPSEAPTVAHARLGAEGLLRLRARYSEVLARISERASDPGEREELKARAERLNPDTWVTDAEVTSGLEGYESVLATFRELLGPRRRRRTSRTPAATDARAADVSSGKAGDSDADDEPETA